MMRKRMRSTRRGATMVLVALTIFLLGGMAALAIEFSRAYVGANELQTGSDAAALAGAHALQQGANATLVDTRAIETAARNNAFGSAITVSADSVQLVRWNPANSTWALAGGATGVEPNAVRVAADRFTGLSFGRLLGLAGLTPRRSAIAWIANVNRLDCIKPLGIPLPLLDSLYGQSFLPRNNADVARLVDFLNDPANQRRMTVVLGPDINNPQGNPPSPDRLFEALPGNSNGMTPYQEAFYGGACGSSAEDYAVGDVKAQPSGGQGSLPRNTFDGLTYDPPNGPPPNCVPPAPNSVDASCFGFGSGTAGISIPVAVVTPFTSPSRARIEMLITFRLMCVFQGNNPGRGNPSERCSWLTGLRARDNGYVQGTIVGYPESATAVGGTSTFGNVLSTSQRLFLVR